MHVSVSHNMLPWNPFDFRVINAITVTMNSKNPTKPVNPTSTAWVYYIHATWNVSLPGLEALPEPEESINFKCLGGNVAPVERLDLGTPLQILEHIYNTLYFTRGKISCVHNNDMISLVVAASLEAKD